MYEDVLKSILAGVYIITVEDKGKKNGMTAIWVNQVSYDPQRIMVAVSPLRRSHDMILASKKFTINVLCEGQEDLARRFGFQTGHEVDKFHEIEVKISSNGCPILPDIHSYINCKLVDTIKIGDHTLLIGDVQEAKLLRKDAEQLIFRVEDYF